MKEDFISMLAHLIANAIIAVILMLVYNAAAWEFNLPTFGYLWHFGVVIILKYIMRNEK